MRAVLCWKKRAVGTWGLDRTVSGGTKNDILMLLFFSLLLFDSHLSNKLASFVIFLLLLLVDLILLSGFYLPS